MFVVGEFSMGKSDLSISAKIILAHIEKEYGDQKISGLTNMAHFSPTAEPVVWHGFAARRLRTAALQILVVPELGAKVVSLKNLSTGREWMYYPTDSPQLFRNQPYDDFARSTMIGWDECLPTIAPCTWRGRSLPDHGEVWYAAWQVDEAAWTQGIIKTSIRLPVSPFEFTRSLEIQNDTLQVNYQLVNLSEEPQEFLWAMHPLLALQTGDRLMLTPETREHLGQPSWIETLKFEGEAASCVKAFAGPLKQGRAGIFNAISDDALIFKWDVAACHTLGLWLTRGGWNGHHHVALEPTNGAPDPLAEAVSKNNCGVLAPRAKKEWTIQIQATKKHRSPLWSAR